MIDSLWNGISGLDIYQRALNSESNNIANVNTVAFKSDKISFADLMYQDRYGKGAQIESIVKDFAQGNMKVTSNAYDLSIVGDGFFTVQDKANNSFYTRAGNFRMGSDGTLQMANGNQVMGLTIDTPTVVSSNTSISQFGDTHINFIATQTISGDTELKTINTNATNYQSTASTSGVSGVGYKSASAKIADIEALAADYRTQLSLYAANVIPGTLSVPQVSASTYDLSLINDESDNISIYVDGTKYAQSYDINAQTTLNKLSDQISAVKGFTSSVDATTGVLTIKSLIPGKSIIISEPKINNNLMNMQTVTTAVHGSGLAAVTSSRDALKVAIEAAGGELLDITNTISLANQDTLSLNKIQLKLDNLKLSNSPFGEFIVENGNLFMKQGNNKFIVGKIVTSIFNDNLSLDPQGNNLYRKTTASGDPIFANNLNKIDNKVLELSNADLSEGLVNLMVYQRSFEANSKSITTSDELLKTTIQLKK